MKLSLTFIILALILIGNLSAETITVDGTPYVCAEEWRNKDFTGRDLSGRIDMSDKVICGSSFSQEVVDRPIFPPSMTGTTFLYCNLDNTSIPVGSDVLLSSQRRFKPQNDLEDWLIDGANKPTEPINKEQFQALGLSILPLDIPAEKQTEPVTSKKARELGAAKDAAVKAFENAYVPAP